MKLTHSKRTGLTLAAVAVAALALAGLHRRGGSGASADSTKSLESGYGSLAENRDAYFFTYYNPAGDPFWAQILQGGEDAAALGNLDLTHQTADGDPDKMVDLVQTAIATEPAVIFMPFNEGEKWVGVACDAHDAGITVVAYNVPAPESAADCVSGFVGQDFFEVGQIVGSPTRRGGRPRQRRQGPAARRGAGAGVRDQPRRRRAGGARRSRRRRRIPANLGQR